MDIIFWQFSDNTPNSYSMANVVTFLIMMHFTCTGTFFEGVACIIVLDFGPRKNPPALIWASGSDR